MRNQTHTLNLTPKPVPAQFKPAIWPVYSTSLGQHPDCDRAGERVTAPCQNQQRHQGLHPQLARSTRTPKDPDSGVSLRTFLKRSQRCCVLRFKDVGCCARSPELRVQADTDVISATDRRGAWEWDEQERRRGRGRGPRTCCRGQGGARTPTQVRPLSVTEVPVTVRARAGHRVASAAGA